jgi:flagellar biogenesis protein FliO
MALTVDQGVAPPEKMKAHSLHPVGCGFGADCSSAFLFPVAVVAIILAVVLTVAWIVGRRLIRRGRRKPSSLG